MKVQVGKSDEDRCIVRVGPTTRNDPDAEVHIVRRDDDDVENWIRVKREYIEGRKLIHFDLPEGVYHVMVVGDKTAGVATTAGHVLQHPWNVFLDAPEDHSKDYMRVSMPTNVPVTGDLARSIKVALQNKRRAKAAATTDQKET